MAISEHAFFCDIFRFMGETERTIYMKGIDFPTGPKSDYITERLLEYIAGKDGITHGDLKISVISSGKEGEKLEQLMQAVNIEGRLSTTIVPEDITWGYMVMDGRVYYLWDSQKPSVYEPEKNDVYFRTLFLDSFGASICEQDFRETVSSKGANSQPRELSSFMDKIPYLPK